MLELFSVYIAKAGGFVIGTLFAYFANRFWTFNNNLYARGSFWRFIILYSITLAANVIVNSVTLQNLTNTTSSLQKAFLLATAVSALLNFLGLKFFVFKNN